MVKDRRSILRTNIRALPVERSGIVIIPEYFQQVVVAKNLRIVRYFNDFRMASGIGADVLIGGIFLASAHVADLRGFHPCQTSKGSFHAPKTACAETGLAELRCHTLIVPLQLR